MCEALWDLMKEDIDEAINNAVDQAYSEALTIGEETGVLKKAKETAFSLADIGLPIEQISQALKYSVEEIQMWLKDGTEN